MDKWVERERRTSALIRACYAAYVAPHEPTADKLHALCKLTWITKGGDEEPPDNTVSVVVPALSALLGRDISATTPSQLGAELSAQDVDEVIARLASCPIGFTNFYTGFRNVAHEWIGGNLAAVAKIVRRVVDGTTDDDVRQAYGELERLPPLPRPRAGDMPAFNLLTPALACLDPRGRAPIINSREAVKRRLRMLGLSSGSFIEQYDGLIGLIGQAGIDDAFALDTADDDQIEKAMGHRAAPKARPPRSPKALGERHDEDVEFLRSADIVKMRRLHNSMTNALRDACSHAGVAIEEGSEQTCLFDALLRSYVGTERHLLIEVKTDDSSPMCRMAVGQLLDYRRQLVDRAAIDLAVLFPAKPSKEARDFLGYVGVKALWFDSDMSKMSGDVPVGPFR